MNRILKYIDKKTPESEMPETKLAPSDKPEGACETCGFCGRPLQESLFTGWTIPEVKPTVGICMSCIDVFGTQTQFTRNFSIWYEDKPNYQPLKQRVMRRIAGEGGSNDLKYTLVELGIRLLKRASGILGACGENPDSLGEKCPKTGVSLTGLPRIAIIGSDIEYCASLLPIIFKELGLIYRSSSKDNLASGETYATMVSQDSGGSTTWAENAVLFAFGYEEAKARCSVIYAGKDEDFPAGIERIYVNQKAKHGSR